jgi:hypothetical protein
MALATADDVATALGRTLTEAEEARADMLIAVTTAAVDALTNNYRFEPDDYTVTRRVQSNGRVILPGAVSAVDEVRSVDCSTGAETVLDADSYGVRGRTIYGLCAGEVAVDFTTEAAVPAAITALVAGVAAATIGSPPVGISAESAGPFQRSFADSSGRVYFSASDKLVLAKYRTPKPAISL